MQQAIEILVGGLLSGAIYALVALGLTLVYRVAGILNLAQGAFVVLGALVFYSLETSAGWPLVPALVAAALGVAAVAVVVAVVAVRPALGRLSIGGILILTAGVLTFFQGVTLVIWGSNPYAVPAFSGEAPVLILGVHVPTQGIWIVAALALSDLALALVLARTTFGKALRACGEDPVAASLMGIDVPRMTVLAFAVAAALGALAGAIVGPLTALAFDTGSFFTNAGFIAVALGGIGSFLGAIAGGLLLGVSEQLAAGYVSSLFSPTLAFVILLAVLVLRPDGVLGARVRRIDVAQAFERPAPVLRFRGRGGLAVAATIVVLVAIAPFLLAGTGLVASLVIAGVFVLSLLGLDLLMGYAGQVSLGHAAFMAIGAYATALLVVRGGVPPLAATAIGLVLTLVVAIGVSGVVARLRGLYLALATLAFGLLVDSLLVGAADQTGGPSGLTGIPSFSLGTLSVDGDVADYYLVWIVVGVAALLLVDLARSDFGRALQAIRADQTAARALGIPVARYKTYAFVIAAGCASIAGSLYAFDFHYLAPDLVSTPRSLELVTMLVVGGQGTLVGPLMGGVALTLLPAVVQPLAAYKTVVEGALLVAVLLYMPGGLAGLLTWRPRPRAAAPAERRAT
ncbi:MAG: ABC transporter permease [Chloroflexota bacterium]|nr:ABC transporter permease [Chloroflexota bacterium]MDE3194641.1 ABC transporter permease [Chloroflexota bacterium]